MLKKIKMLIEIHLKSSYFLQLAYVYLHNNNSTHLHLDEGLGGMVQTSSVLCVFILATSH